MSSQRFTLGSPNIGTLDWLSQLFGDAAMQDILHSPNSDKVAEMESSSCLGICQKINLYCNSCVMKLSASHLRTKQCFFGISSFSSTSCGCCHKKWTNISTSSHQQPQPERNASENLTTRFILGPDSSANERLEGVLWRSLLLSIALMPDL